MSAKTSDKIANIIQQRGQATGKYLSEILGLSDRAIRNQLNNLLQRNILTKVGKPPTVFYSLKTKSKPRAPADNRYALNTNDKVLDADEKSYVLKVKDIEEDKRPRERIIKHGPSALSSAELLAIILNTGTKKEDVLAMSRRILGEYGEKSLPMQTNVKLVSEYFDIPIVKACQVIATFALGKRFFQEYQNGLAIVRTAKQAFNYLKDMRLLQKEQFRALYLNSRYRVIYDEVVSVGSLTANIVHPREVFLPAISHNAVAVIVAHNHPSGSLKPSDSDIELTQQLAKAGQIIGIDLLDHLIIGKNKFYSIPINS